MPNDATGSRADRLFSPVFAVPANAEYVTIDFDIANNTESDPNYRYIVFDGVVLRVTDQTTGRFLRSVLLEAFEEEFTTGEVQAYPKHMYRGSNSLPFTDLSCWGGWSRGFQHVHAKLPAAQLTPTVGMESLNGATIQLRFEYQQDSGGTAFDVRPQNTADPTLATSGIAVDNIVVAAVNSAAVAPTPTPTPSPAASPTPSPAASPTPSPAASPTPSPAASPTPSPAASPTPSPTATPASQAVNVSTRMRVDRGENAGIGGFIITGSAPKHVIIRAIGPSLTRFGFDTSEVLADPTLEVHGPGSFGVITNDNWRDSQEAQIKADGLPPTNDLEAAIDATLPPGAYTAIIRGNGTGAGAALFEVYDLDTAAASKLSNLSTRAFVGTGNNVVIAGFVLGNNSGDGRVVVRGLGPSLAAFGVSNPLADPTLELRDQNGTLVEANNDWQDDATQAADITAANLAPADSREAAISATLPAGLYTAILAGQNNGTGVGIVEVYDRGP
jgi:hypothetical protein